MFIHNLKYSLKILFKNKMLIFWTFAFPIILGTFFNMAFSNIEKSEKLDIISIAIVETEEFKNNKIYQEIFQNLSNKKNKDRLFNIQYVSLKEAKELLKTDKITGYLLLNDNCKIVINKNGINETIFKCVVEEVSQTEKMMSTILEEKISKYIENGTEKNTNLSLLYNKINEEIASILKKEQKNIEDISTNNLSYTMIEYYSLIAMACLYGAILSLVAINHNLANMSSNGKRISISPTSKKSLIISSLLSSYITQIIGVSLLFIYTTFVLKVNYGPNLALVILLALVGCLAGLSLGLAIGVILKTNEDIKRGLIIVVTMFCCFLSGMMGITMKYIIDKNIPIINKINPASMITDGFYSLYYYDTLNRYWFNIISLLIFAFIFITISMLSLRRQKYDSI